jgi:hypothetical protein
MSAVSDAIATARRESCVTQFESEAAYLAAWRQSVREGRAKLRATNEDEPLHKPRPPDPFPGLTGLTGQERERAYARAYYHANKHKLRKRGEPSRDVS